MRPTHFALGLMLTLLGACADQHLPNATAYIRSTAVQDVPLRFQPNSTRLLPDSEARLRAVRDTLPGDAELSLASGRLASARAQQIGAELARLVPPVAESPALGADRAVLHIAATRLVATDCLMPGQPVARDNWPGDDAGRPRSMPAGCASANVVQQMAVSQEDLQHGRPLPPGAALPVARAIERYYSRFELAPAATGQTSPGQTSPGQTSPGAGAGNAAAGAAGRTDGQDGAGLLQGPLPQTAPATAGSAATPAQ